MKKEKHIEKVQPDHHVHRGAKYKTIIRHYGGIRLVIEVPEDMTDNEMLTCGYKLKKSQNDMVRIRMIPKEKYSRYAISWSQLYKKLKLIIQKEENLGPRIVPLPDDPVNLLELKGKVHRVHPATIRRHYHFIKSHYENPDECRRKDYLLD